LEDTLSHGFGFGLSVISGDIGGAKDDIMGLFGDVFDYFKCTKKARGVYDIINKHMTPVNNELSSVGFGTVDAYDIGSCDRSDNNCGHLDHDACEADKQAISAALEQLNVMQSFIGSLDGLRVLANTVLDPQAEVSADSLPRIALLRSTLGSIDASVVVSLLTKAALLGDVAKDVKQLIALLINKEDVLTNYYKSKLAGQAMVAGQQMFAAKAERANRLARQYGEGSSQHENALVDYNDDALREKCLVMLRYHIEQVQAFKFMALQAYPHLDDTPEALKAEQMTAQDYHDLLVDAHGALIREWSSTLSRSNNCGGSCWSTVEFTLAELHGNTFAVDGKLTVDIAIPEVAAKSHVTFADVHIYLLGLTATATEPFQTSFVKRGSSKLLDSDGKVCPPAILALSVAHPITRNSVQVWEFTHMDTTPAFEFGYETSTSGTSSLCDTDSVYMEYSPYGIWDLSVLKTYVDLSTVYAVRFAFQVLAFHSPCAIVYLCHVSHRLTPGRGRCS
jgi:hypothetical protein